MRSQSVYYLWIESDAIENRIDLSEVIDWMMMLFGSSFLFAKKVQHMGEYTGIGLRRQGLGER